MECDSHAYGNWPTSFELGNLFDLLSGLFYSTLYVICVVRFHSSKIWSFVHTFYNLEFTKMITNAVNSFGNFCAFISTLQWENLVAIY